jgi:RHS repeat-associated protein
MKCQVNSTQFFYQNGKLATVSQPGQQRAIFRSAELPLAELEAGSSPHAALLETDQSGSVLAAQRDSDEEEHYCYTVYGHDPSQPSVRTQAGFNGERIEAVAQGYLLGNGYRLYNPALMRFQAPDNISPFDEGGLNAYSYCQGDPVNNTDPSGHFSLWRPQTWITTRTTRNEQRLAALNKLIPDIEAKTSQIAALNGGYTDLSKNAAKKIFSAQLEKLIERAERKANKLDTYKYNKPERTWEIIEDAKITIKPPEKYIHPQKVNKGPFGRNDRRPNPYGDGGEDQSKSTSITMNVIRKT